MQSRHIPQAQLHAGNHLQRQRLSAQRIRAAQGIMIRNGQDIHALRSRGLCYLQGCPYTIAEGSMHM